MEEAKYNMEFTVGEIVEGKVKSITNFGAFVALPENKIGMVHISEVANAYVSDIHAHLTVGQDVKAVVISNENGKINLSIKRLEARVQKNVEPRNNRPNFDRPQNRSNFRPAAPTPPPAPKTADQLFEEKLKAFMTESDSKLSSMKRENDHRPRRRK